MDEAVFPLAGRQHVPPAGRWVLEGGWKFAATGGGTVFRRQQQVKTNSELMRDELGEGIDHLRLAAAHAAGTAAGMIAPRLELVRGRLEPTYDRSKDIARISAKRANRIARRATGKKKES